MSTFVDKPFPRANGSGTPHEIPAASKSYVKDQHIPHVSIFEKMP